MACRRQNAAFLEIERSYGIHKVVIEVVIVVGRSSQAGPRSKGLGPREPSVDLE
jgi:hypothetical protein